MNPSKQESPKQNTQVNSSDAIPKHEMPPEKKHALALDLFSFPQIPNSDGYPPGNRPKKQGIKGPDNPTCVVLCVRKTGV